MDGTTGSIDGDGRHCDVDEVVECGEEHFRPYKGDGISASAGASMNTTGDRSDSRVRSLMEEAYAAFNRRDIDGALAAMTADVQWSNGWEGGYVLGQAGVRDYWTRQWKQLDPTVKPVSVNGTEDGRVRVRVDQTIRQPDGTVLRAGLVDHVYTLSDGLIARMDIESC